jgi:hypothetical protein
MAYVTDARSYAPVNYYVLLPPDRGETYIDPAFGTTIKRISDARAQPNSAGDGTLTRITHEYATMAPFNQDNSRLILAHQSYYALHDGSGNYLRDLPFEMTEPRWSRHDPNVIYYLRGNQLKQYDAGSGLATTVHTFGEYSTVSGKGESDVCFDGDHFVLVGDDRDIFVYEVSTATKGPVLDAEGRTLDSVQITPDDNVTMTWVEPGEGRFNGIELHDRSMNFLRQLLPRGGHADVMRDTDGEEVLVTTADPAAACNGTIVKIRLADGEQTCLLLLDPSLAIHISAPDGSGWVIVSTYAPSDPGPFQGWTSYTNEILQVKLDGSTVRRLAQHRSRPFNDYTWTPRAAVSRDGGRLVYSSNYGLPGILGHPAEYADVYSIDLSSSVPTTAGSASSSAYRFEEDDPAVGYGGPWPAQANPAHSGGTALLGMDPGALATVRFQGSAVSWIGFRDEWSGIARVHVDGTLRAEIDTYAPPSRAEAQALIYTISGLGPGPHTLAIEATQRMNPRALGSWVWVDGFETAP